MAELSSVSLDHFLVEHTLEQAGVIAHEINKKQYDVLYFELCTDPVTQTFHQRILNQVIASPTPIDLTQIAERDVHLHIAAGLDQPGAEVIVIDYDFGLKTPAVVVDGFEAAFIKRVQNARHSRFREPVMASQIEEDIKRNRMPEQIGAIITGALHIEVSNILLENGARINQVLVGNAKEYVLDKEPEWDQFNKISTHFISAIEYALRHGADVEATRQALYEVITRSRH